MAEQKIMTRVMKLLERAEHPETPPAEAQSCRELADTLMARHMIDRMDLKPEAKSSVVQDHWDIMWSDVDVEFRYNLQTLMTTVVNHCGIRVHPKTSYGVNEDGTTDYKRRRFTLVGFPEDMAYADAIWFRVFREFVSNVSPKWDVSLTLAQNVYNFARAGLSWGQAHAAAEASSFDYGLPPLLKGGGAKLRNVYRAECERRGEEYSKTRTHDAYRSTFVQSYSATIGKRLSEMRAKASETVGDADKFALAIRSTKERVDDEFYRLFPEFDPNVLQRMRENEEFEMACKFAALSPEEQALVIAQQEKEQREWERKWRARMNRASTARRNYGSVRERTTYDESAWERGNSVASKVNLNVDPEVKKGNRGELK